MSVRLGRKRVKIKVPGWTTHLEETRSDQKLGCGKALFMEGVVGVGEWRGLERGSDKARRRMGRMGYVWEVNEPVRW